MLDTGPLCAVMVYEFNEYVLLSDDFDESFLIVDDLYESFLIDYDSDEFFLSDCAMLINLPFHNITI